MRKLSRLGDHCRIRTGFRDVNEGNPHGVYPFFTCSRNHTFSDTYTFDTEAILIAGNGDVGNLHYFNGKFEAYQRTYVLDDFCDIDQRYAYHYLSAFLLGSLQNYKIGTSIPYIKLGHLEQFPIELLGGKQEQQRIAEILSTVDEAIEQTEALIAKTQQIKAGLMHDLFTRGVTPASHLRPPREEAPHLYKESPLGWIPKEWDAGGLEEYLVQPGGLKSGPFGSALTKGDFVESGYRVYGQEQVLAGSLEVGNYYIPHAKWLELSDFRVVEGDVLMTLVGVGTVGKIIVVEDPFEPGVINPRLMRIRPDRSKSFTGFLASLIPSTLVRRQFNQYATGGTMPVLNSSIVRKVRLPIVPRMEQERIAERIEVSHEAIKAEQSMLTKQRLLKSGLMHDLLTGRVGVNVSEPAST